jgi:hypothetical protein
MRDGGWLRRNWLLAVATLVGSGLRLYQIKTQIIADDEWHAVRMVDLDFFTIASHFGESDVSIPIALFYRLVIATFGLSEWIMRAPVLFCGLLSLVVFPLIVRRFFDQKTSVLFAWLLAISPIHVYYSRFARPYSIALFFGFCGVSAFHLWWTTRNPRWKWVYGVCAIVGPYFSLSVLPVTCAPLALTYTRAIWKRNRDPELSFGQLVRLSLFVGGGLTVLLLAPIYGDFAALAQKAGQGTLTSDAAIAAFELFLGMGEVRLVQAISLAVMIVGTFFLARRQPGLALLLGTCAGGAILTILVSRPAAIEFPVVIARYAIFLLPVVLMVLAIGLRTIGSFVTGSERYATLIIGIGWIVVIANVGPLRQIYYAPNNFTNHAMFQYYPSLDPERNPFAKSLSRPFSAYYGKLSEQPPASLRIIEAPWYYEWAYNPFPFYQRVHHQLVEIGFVRSEADPPGEVPAFDRRFRFHNFVHLQDINTLCAHKIDRVVLHKDLEKEVGRTTGRDFSREMPMLIAQYQHAFGPPVFEDEWLVVFTATRQCLAKRSTVIPFSTPDRGGNTSTSNGSITSVSVGYGIVQPDARSMAPSGVAIFDFRQNNTLVSEMEVPATATLTSGRIYAEISDVVNAGVTIVNPNASAARISFYFTDLRGNSAGSGAMTIPANQQISQFLDQAPFNVYTASTFLGTFSFTSSVPVAVAALRGFTNERGEFLMSTLPVIDTTIAPNSGTTVIPHFADGGGWTTQLLLVNPTDNAMAGTIRFLDPNGRAVNVTISGQRSNFFSYSVAGRTSQKFVTTSAAAATASGSIRILPTGTGPGPTPLVLFSYKPAAVTVSVAGVPAVSSTAFRMYVESSGKSGQSGSIQSGLAVANASSSSATVTFEVTDLAGSAISGISPVSTTLPAAGQAAKFLNDVFPSLPNPFQGVLRIKTSSTAIAIVGLRSRVNERGDFLVTTTPPSVETAPAAAGPLFFPEIADGGGYTTQFILFSGTTGSSANGTVTFTKQDGTPFILTLR